MGNPIFASKNHQSWRRALRGLVVGACALGSSVAWADAPDGLQDFLVHGSVSPGQSAAFEKALEASAKQAPVSDPLADLPPTLARPVFLFPPASAEAVAMRDLQNEYGANFSTALEFIDLPDVLSGIANSPRERVWKRYDEPGKRPMLDRWRDATNPATPAASILDLGRVVGDDPKLDFRGHSIVAGGDIFLNGRGYYRVNAQQRDRVLANPFLTAEVVADPWPPKPSEPTFLVRHQYPSAANWTRFRDRLSGGLVHDLQQAGDQLNDTDSRVFHALTKRILRELTDAAMASDISPLMRYQIMISIHPFRDYNGRTMRALFARQAGYALFLPNFDQDLFLSYEELAAAELSGRSDLAAIRRGLKRMETEAPHKPDYYRTPELWETQARVKVPPGAMGAFIDHLQERFKRPDFQNLVRQKQYYDFELRVTDLCSEMFGKISSLGDAKHSAKR